MSGLSVTEFRPSRACGDLLDRLIYLRSRSPIVTRGHMERECDSAFRLGFKVRLADYRYQAPSRPKRRLHSV